MVLVVAAAWELDDPIFLFVEVVSRLSLGIPSTVADVNLLEEEISWKRVVGGDVRPVQATILGVAAVCLLPRLH